MKGGWVKFEVSRVGPAPECNYTAVSEGNWFILFVYLVSKKEALAFFSAFENSFKFAKPLRKSSQEKLRH